MIFRLAAIFLSAHCFASAAAAECRSDEFYQFLNQKMTGIDLEWLAQHNQYFIKGEVNGQDGRFQLDSGAGRSVLALGSMEKFKLEATATDRKGSGIGGGEKSYVTTFESMRLGPHIRISSQKITVLGMSRAADSDGLIGADILRGAKAVVDHRHHRLLYANSAKQVNLLATAKKFGMSIIPLTGDGSHLFIDVKIHGQPARMLLDTGAQQSVLDSAVAKRLGLSSVASKIEAVGIGDGAGKLRLASIVEMEVGELRIKRMPMMLMPLRDVQGKKESFDGILGAEFLFAAEAIFDAGNKCLILSDHCADVRDFTKTGSEMFANDKQLKTALESAPWVGGVRLAGLGIIKGMRGKGSDGSTWSGIQVTVKVQDTIKGEKREVGSEIVFTTVVPDTQNFNEWLQGLFGRNPEKILFFDPEAKKGASKPYNTMVFTDGELPRAQIKRVQQGKSAN